MDTCVVNGVATLSCLPCLIKNVINFGIALGGLLAVYLVVFSGIKYITSNGDQYKVDAAKKTITYALVGLVIIILSFAVVNFAGKTFNIKILDLCP